MSSLQTDDLWDLFYTNIPDLENSGFICSKRKYCSYKIPSSKQFEEIGGFISTIGFAEIKNNIDIKYRDCVSRKQIKQTWNSKGNRVPLLAGEIIRALLTINNQGEHPACNWHIFIRNIGAMLESAQEHGIE